MTNGNVVVIGAGQGGFQVASSLRAAGYQGRITLVGEERYLPYQRPPLSKGYLEDGKTEKLFLRPDSFFDSHGIDLELGVRATAIDRTRRIVTLENGQVLPYDHLVLATGASPRTVPVAGLDAVRAFQLRSFDDACAMREELLPGRRLVIIGGGFIGLELATVGRRIGLDVTVLELEGRLMRRAVSEHVAAFLEDKHRKAGIKFHLGTAAKKVDLEKAGAPEVELSDGSRVCADLLVVATGVMPNVALAREAGISIGDGVVVDEYLRTSDPHISAIGDCASFPCHQTGGYVRLESVQGAVDQAKCVAADILGTREPYRKLAWFWSEQGQYKLQIAGMTAGADHYYVSRDGEDRISAFCFKEGKLVGLESVNAPVEHLKCRKLFDRRADVSLDEAAAKNFSLSDMLG